MNEFRSQVFGGPRRKEELLGAKKPRGARADAGLQSVKVPRSEARTSDSRGGDRHRLTGERVRLAHGRRKHDVELVNLSGGGAMVEGAFEPLLWDRVELHLGEGQSLGCVVRWIRGSRVGLEFAAETQLDCSPAELQSLLHAVVARSFPEVAVDVSVPGDTGAAATKAKRKSAEEGRRAKRVPLIWTGQVHYDFTTTPIRLRNISSTGAMIECEFALPVGGEPLLDLGESGQIFATVSWRHGEQIGLAFKAPFDMAMLARSKPALAPAWRPPSHIEVDDEAEALNWDELSEAELRERLEGFLKR